MWRAVAYAARYGKQRIPDMMRMTLQDFWRFHAALADLVGRENDTGSDPEG